MSATRRDASPGKPCKPEDILRLVVEGPTEDREIPLPDDLKVGTVFDVNVTPFWIGFNRGCFQDRPNDLILDGVGLSRNSCFFVFHEGRWFGNDDGGTTPLKINGEKARGTPVKDGDVVDVGRVRCRARLVTR